jgi:hypothetical protein
LAVFIVILIGIPIYYATVGRPAARVGSLSTRSAPGD